MEAMFYFLVFTCWVVGAVRDRSLEEYFGVVARLRNTHIFTVFHAVYEEALRRAIGWSLNQGQVAFFLSTANLSALTLVGNVGQVSQIFRSSVPRLGAQTLVQLTKHTSFLPEN